MHRLRLWSASAALALTFSLALEIAGPAFSRGDDPTDLSPRASAPGESPALARLAAQETPNVTMWRWLKDTYWYVPATNLPAVLFDAQNRRLAPVADQTVYHITEYRDGYFWGPTAVKLGSAAVSCLSLVGSVTPEGSVFLAFTPTDVNANTSITQGTGQMRLRLGQWTMENQMSSGPVRLQVTHWAYMFQTQPGDPSWLSLPGLGISVEELLGQCPPGPQPGVDGTPTPSPVPTRTPTPSPTPTRTATPTATPVRASVAPAIAPLPPRALGAQPLLPPVPLLLTLPLPPLMAVNPATAAAGRVLEAEVPIVPEAESAGLIALGMAGLAVAAVWQRGRTGR